jgi:uncharacterized protein (UPF0305 family)
MNVYIFIILFFLQLSFANINTIKNEDIKENEFFNVIENGKKTENELFKIQEMMQDFENDYIERLESLDLLYEKTTEEHSIQIKKYEKVQNEINEILSLLKELETKEETLIEISKITVLFAYCFVFYLIVKIIYNSVKCAYEIQQQ